MKIKIIKRAAHEKVKEKIFTTEDNQSKNSDTQKDLTATIKFWIKDFRKKCEREQLSVQNLFKEQCCAQTGNCL